MLRRGLPFLVSLSLLLTPLPLASAAEIVLTFANPWGPGPFWDYYEKAFTLFSAEHPGVRVEQVSSSFDLSWLLVRSAAGTPPDVYPAYQPLMTPLAIQGVLAPLDAYVNRSGLRGKDFIPAAWNAGVWDGVRYGIPAHVEHMAIMLNRRLFSEAGLGADQPPATPADLLQLSKKLTRRDAEGHLLQVGILPWIGTGWMGDVMLNWFLSFGAENIVNVAGRVVDFQQPDVLAATRWVMDFVSLHHPTEVERDLEGGLTSFFNEKSAMHYSYVPIELYWAKNEYPSIPLNVWATPSVTGRNEALLMPYQFVMLRGSKHPDWAFRLIEWMGADPRGTAAWAAHRNFPGLLTSEAWRLIDDPVVRTTGDIMTSARRSIMEFVIDLHPFLQEAFTKIMLDGVAPQTALAAAEQKAQAELQRVIGDR